VSKQIRQRDWPVPDDVRQAQVHFSKKRSRKVTQRNVIHLLQLAARLSPNPQLPVGADPRPGVLICLRQV